MEALSATYEGRDVPGGVGAENDPAFAEKVKAMQTGHFNDFLFVCLVRAAFLGALDGAGPDGLSSDMLGSAQQKALGFDRAAPAVRAEWLQEPGLKGFHLTEAESTLRHRRSRSGR